LLARPVPRRAEMGGAVHKQCTDPLVQGRPGPCSGARGWDGGPPRKGEAGAENEASLRDEGADHQPKPSGLGGVGCRAQVVESRPYRRHALGLGEDGGGKVRGEDECIGCRVSAGRGSQRGTGPEVASVPASEAGGEGKIGSAGGSPPVASALSAGADGGGASVDSQKCSGKGTRRRGAAGQGTCARWRTRTVWTQRAAQSQNYCQQ
jgi:hypothetical protein